jgi:tetraprenyl-beta-curcumene synthase
MLCGMMARQHRLSAYTAGFVSAATRYWLTVYPQVRREVDHWRRRARSIASPGLRTLALQNLDTEDTNLEGAAAFATFVAPIYRGRVIRAQVAFQAAYDYADSLAETPSSNPASNARQLHLSLLAAVAPTVQRHNYYAQHTEDDDGGYLVALVKAARTSLIVLPSYETVSQLLQVGVARIVQYQTRIGEPRQLAAWMLTRMVPDCRLAWWELAAAGGSSMGVFALMASAARPSVGTRELTDIERAYFPWIGALHTLLDSLIDRPDDLAVEQHSLVDYYGSEQVMIERLTLLATEARRKAQALPDGRDHTLILAGMVGLYLSSTQAATSPARLVGARLKKIIGPLAWPTMVVFHLRRFVAHFCQR